jgi:hypothetical protein
VPRRRAAACAVLVGMAALAAGGGSAGAAAAGTMTAWGTDADGQLGNGAAAGHIRPGGRRDYSVALVRSP